MFGAESLARNSKNVDAAYDRIAFAIAEYERSTALNPFTSKHDLAMTRTAPARMMTFTTHERQGMMLFNGNKPKCSTCHVTPMSGMGGGGMGGGAMPWVMPTGPVLFSDYRYANVGIPKNWDSPYLGLPRAFNPDGLAFIDHGLAAVLTRGVAANAEYDGMFRTPSLRNVALTAPYGHNGYFETLKEIVHFYNTRDVHGADWPEAEVPSTMDTALMGDLGHTDAEENHIVAFLQTLTDGWWQRP